MPRIKRKCSNFNADFNANNSNFNIDFSKKESKFGSAIEKDTEILINELESRVVPRRLDDFETIDGEDITDNSYLYVDNNGEDSKFGVHELLNKIESIKVNNTDLPITDKSVNILVTQSGELITPDPSTGSINVEVPTKTSDLINDGDGTSIFTTKEYVDEKIISGAVSDVYVDGVSVVNPTNKIAEINLPYTAGNGLVLNNYEFSLDDLILDCGTSIINV